MSEWKSADIVTTTYGTIKKAQQESFDEGVAFERDRITGLVYATGVKIIEDALTTERDIQAMEHVIRLLKNNIVSAIKGENK